MCVIEPVLFLTRWSDFSKTQKFLHNFGDIYVYV